MVPLFINEAVRDVFISGYLLTIEKVRDLARQIVQRYMIKGFQTSRSCRWYEKLNGSLTFRKHFVEHQIRAEFPFPTGSLKRYKIFETTSIIRVHRSSKYFPIHHQFQAFPDFQIYFRIPHRQSTSPFTINSRHFRTRDIFPHPSKYGQWGTIGNNRRAPGIIILRFEDDHPTTDLRNWEREGVEGRCSSVHRIDRSEIPHSNLSHKLPENELAREVADFQELMECLMVLSGGLHGY
ncbi:hypothetical protein CEXT_614231 [Caerostris extrusa]|uniref:Uncharacterized protein n=1 Tax=Caerostris extrusa TaxID=172846 RepID=A0AAV4X267_CAEEX|nr:hypothetical protein CEXT_614231 [Caerostris extrusa]